MFIARNERRIRYSEFICIFYHPVSFYSEQIFQTLNPKIQLKIFSNHTFKVDLKNKKQGCTHLYIYMITVQYYFGNIDIILEVNWP